MYETTVTLSIGRLVLGTGAGIMNIVFGAMISETIPSHLIASFSMMHNGSINIGYIPALGLAALLPDPKDFEANKEDELWRVIWISPAIIGTVVILLILLVFKEEPVNYCLMKGRNDEALKHLNKVYRKKKDSCSESKEQLLEAHYGFLKDTTKTDAASIPFKEAVCGRKYRKAAWVCAFLSFFNQWSGICAIIIFTNRLLTKMSEQEDGGSDFPITPLQGTYIIGLANIIGSNIPVLYSGKVGRRPVFILGQLGMATSLFLVGLSVYQQWNMTSFIMIIVFIFSYQLAQGNFCFLYIPEVCVDSATGLALGS